MKAVLLTLLLGLTFTFSKSQSADCDIATTGVSIVNAANTAPVSSICLGQTAKFKFSIFNAGAEPSCTIPANSVEAVFSLPASRYSYNGPTSFSTGYFTWTYSMPDRALIGINTTAIPNGAGDADILVSVMGTTAGGASSNLNITQNGATSDNTGNNNGSAQLNINALPVATISYNGSPYCNVGTAAVTQTGQTGGMYAAAPSGLNINSATGEINLAVSTPGNYTVTYSFSNANCSNITTASVTVTAKPTASINYTGSPFCTTAAPVSPNLGGTGAYTGGTYSAPSSLTINSANGTITPSTSTPGTYTVTYTTPAGGGCDPVSTTTMVTITAQPTASISYDNMPYCTTVTSAPPTLNGSGAYTGGNYNSTAGLIINSGSGAINPSTSMPGTYTVTYTTPASGGCAAVSTTTNVTITAQPTASISYSSASYCTTITSASPVLTGTGAYTNGTYSSTTGLTINSTTGEINPGTSMPGTYTITYTIPAGGGCSSVSATTNVTITAQPTVSVSYIGSPYCTTVTSATPTLSGSGAYTGGTYSSTTGLTLNATTGEINPSTSTPSGYTVTYTTPASGGCAAVSNTANVTIMAAPNAGMLGGNQAICVGGSTTFVSNGQAGSYSSDNTGVATVDPSTGVVTGIGAGTATITYTVTGGAGCASATATRSITVTAQPNAGTLNGTQAICVGSTTAFSSNGQAGGNYSSNNTAVATIDPSIGIVTGVGAGTATITYIVTGTGGCANATATRDVTVTAAPNAGTLSGDQAICISGNTTFVSSGQSGSFSSGNNGIATVDATSGVITGAGAGTTTITYTVTGTGGCSNATATRNVTVTASPTANISYTGSPYCTTTTSALPTLAGMGAYTGGTYSSTTGLTINSTTGEINPSTSTPGGYTVTYTTPSSGGCGPVSTTINVTITAQPTASISYTGSPFCTTASPVSPTLTGTGAYTGGTYSAPSGLTINSTDGTITPATSTAGTYTINYSTPVGGGCAPVNATTSVTITAQPTASISYGGSSYCATATSATPTLTGTGAYTGGTYSSTTGLTINTSTGEINPSTSMPGTYTVTYTTPASGGCAAASTTTMVTITAAPTASISYAGSPYCTTVTNATPMLTGTGAYTGGTYSSTTGLTINTASGEIDPSTSTPGTYTITYDTPAGGGCSSVSTTTNVTITAAPNAGTLSGNQAICVGGTTTFTTNGNAGGTYSSDNTGIATVNASTGMVMGGAAGSATITYTVTGTGGCGNATATRTVTVTAPPNAGTLSGTQNICIGGTTIFTSDGQSGGTYSSNNTSAATVDPSSGLVTGVAAGTANITYTVTGTGGCANATATRSVTVTAPPNAGTLDGNQSICVGGTTTFTTNGQSGGSFSSNNTGVATVDAMSGAVTGLSAGTTTITYTVTGTGGCNNATAMRTVTVSNPPNAGTLSGDQAICIGGTTTFVSDGQSGGSFSSDNTGIATVNSSTGVVTGASAGTATITYTITGNGGCANATSARNVTVTAPPNAGTLSGNQNICVGSTTTFTSNGQSGGGFSCNNNSVATVDAMTGVVTGTGAGTATITYTVTGSGGCGDATAIRSVTVTAPPNAGILSGNQSICVGGTTTFTTNGQSGGSFSSNNTGVATVDPMSGVVTGVTAGTTTIAYTVSGSGGCGNATATRSVTVNTLPQGSISGTTTATQSNVTTSPITFTGSGGSTPYTFTYNVNGGPTQTVSTTGSNTSVIVSQSNAVMGTYTYNLLSTTSAAGCTSTNAAPATAIVSVTDAQPFDLFATIPRPISTNFFSGQQSEGYVQISNSTANPTTGQVVFSISKASNFTLSVPVNMTSAAGTPVNNADWTITDNGFSYIIRSTKVTAIGANSNIKIGFVLTAMGSAGTSGIITLGIFDDTGGISTGRGDSSSSNNQAIKVFSIN